ncbi:NAD(P)H-dependent glycerol-3-phosphate dehydrogenase [alpha proteobacterium IMCC14465]|uniref:Glycerol-3-phosphate dehydrogenase [NAD(P)+] n=1 Tax=alpha proteobacterium IMCC14465 TaxID=1220535 RepID=J9A4C6_9PROT|nr:NAD(P)H-dependent glycerol-3-phosphate dehydrogenase [alpha proteobacterium IMCC14465]
MKEEGSEFKTPGVVGAGAWGTALAELIARHEKPVKLWAFEEAVIQSISKQHENTPYLPGIQLSPYIAPTADMQDLAECDLILMVTPAQHMAQILQNLKPHIGPDAILVLCAKGLEQNSLKFMSDVASDYFETSRLAVLSGPSFAADVAKGLPTAVTLACQNMALGEKIAATIGHPSFRFYMCDDLIGAEIGGVVKNILAIACGIVDGRGMGESARAAVTARGYAEMTRLGIQLGANPQTLGGLAGLGDLILTCTSTNSRNYSLGVALGKGDHGANANDIMASRSSVSEGALSAPALIKLADKHQVEMPICNAVAEIVAGKLSVDMAISQLLARPFTSEI